MNETPQIPSKAFDVLEALSKPKHGRRRFTFADRNAVIRKFRDSHGTSYVQMGTGQICRSAALQISDTVTVGGIKLRRGRPTFGGFSKKFRRVLRRAMARSAA